MGTFQRFQDEGYKNWIKTSLGLAYLKTRLGSFLENETETYHQDIKKIINWNGQLECRQKCVLKESQPKSSKVRPNVCEVCVPWRDEIWKNHKGGQVYWNNFSPYLWPNNKWEVAKVYMGRGNSTHNSADTFDISAFLNLMSTCQHFKRFAQHALFTQVTNVRNQVMHSANFEVKAEKLKEYLNRIRALGKALEKHAPEFHILDKEIDELQNLDFTVISALETKEWTEQSVQTESEDRAKRFLSMELDIMKEKMECLAQDFEEDRENMLKPEELQCVRQFLEENKDLKESLVPQWERLKEVQEQHGQQIDSLTDRVDELEKKSHTPDQEWDTDIRMYKNHLFEYARKHGCSEPLFTQILESTGFRGQVSIKNQTFTGMRVHRAKRQSDQEVAKIALEHLVKETASEQVDEDTSVSQTHQSESVSAAGSTFFGSVTVGLDVTVFSDEGGGAIVEGVESAYRKLMPVFGLELSGSGYSYKDAVVQYCLRRDVPAPEEIDKSDRFTLRLKGPITFYDSEGSSKKKHAQQQAAKAALRGLSGVLGKKEVSIENCVGALKELLDARKLEGVDYDVTQRPVSSGEREGGLGNQDSQRQEAERQRERESGQATERSTEETIKALGRKRSVEDMPGRDGRIEDAVGSCRISESPTVQPGQSLKSQVPLQPHATETQTAAALSEERSVSGDGGRFLGSVKLTVMKLEPAEALSQEEAVQAAYSSLLNALCLGPTTGLDGGDRDSVLGFFTQSKWCPPVEKLETTADGKHRCTLTIDGELTFYNPEGSSKKQQAEQWAAKEALRCLLGGKDSNLPGEKNYKGKLQELFARQGSKVKVEYSVTERKTLSTVTALVQVPDGSAVIGPGQQAGVPSVIPLVTMDTAFDDSAPPPAKKIAKLQADGPMEEIRQFLLLVSVKPGTVVCESVNLEEKWECRVSVSLKCFTYQDHRPFTSKKEASDNAYLTLGIAGQICQPDESKVKAKVNQYFSQHSFPLPKDVYEQPEAQKFCCTLTNITCVFTYTGTDSSEASARQAAFRTALSCVSPLMGFPLALPTRAEDAEQRLKTLLETAGVNTTDPVLLTSALYRSSAMLIFTGYCMETDGEGSKKETRHKLSQRLLRLLQGPDSASTSKDQTMRSALEEWFAKKRLDKPVFEDTDGKFGTRITFSAPLCLYSDWQDSHKNAGGRLVDELKRRFQISLPV